MTETPNTRTVALLAEIAASETAYAITYNSAAALNLAATAATAAADLSALQSGTHTYGRGRRTR